MPIHPTQAIRSLEPADHEAALALVAEAGWNQIAADWRLFTDLGEAFAICDDAGRVIATAAILPATGFGWISMVLVARTHRRQGLATALLQHGIARLQQQGLVPMLDATPAGRTVYQPLGFRDGWAITRWRRSEGDSSLAAAGAQDFSVRPFTEADWPQVDALDGAAFGADRTAVLRRLHARSRGFACVAQTGGRVTGFLLGRDGRNATQVGPVVAQDVAAAGALLHHALSQLQGPVLVDVLDCHAGLAPQLAQAGFAIERSYTRMALGSTPNFGDAARMVAIAGPELG
jgi:GNAT superfamily N-acetyltransferase